VPARAGPFFHGSIKLERPTQLSWLCACGQRPMELKGPGFCRACYYRRYHSLRSLAVFARRCSDATDSGTGYVEAAHRCWFTIAAGITKGACSSPSASVAMCDYTAIAGSAAGYREFCSNCGARSTRVSRCSLRLPLAISTRAADEKAGPARTGEAVAHGLFYRRAECQAASR
jgi:hypothetical protein